MSSNSSRIFLIPADLRSLIDRDREEVNLLFAGFKPIFDENVQVSHWISGAAFKQLKESLCLFTDFVCIVVEQHIPKVAEILMDKSSATVVTTVSDGEFGEISLVSTFLPGGLIPRISVVYALALSFLGELECVSPHEAMGDSESFALHPYEVTHLRKAFTCLKDAVSLLAAVKM